MLEDVSEKIYSTLQSNAEALRMGVQDACLFGFPIERVESCAGELSTALELGVDPDFRQTATLLELALLSDDIESAKLLLKAGAVCDAASLVSCQSFEALSVIRSFTDKIPNDKNGRGVGHIAAMTPFCLLSTLDSPNKTASLIEKLSELGYVEAFPDKFGLYPHDYAALNRNRRSYELLRKQADSSLNKVDHSDSSGKTALFKAVALNDARTVERLITSGASLNLLDYEQNSLLSIAIKHQHNEVLDILLVAGAEHNPKLKITNPKQMQAAIKSGHLGSALLAFREGVPLPSFFDALKTLHPRFIDILDYPASTVDPVVLKRQINKLMPLVVCKAVNLMMRADNNVVISEGKSKYTALTSKLTRAKELRDSYRSREPVSEYLSKETNEIYLTDLDAAGPCWLQLTMNVPVVSVDRCASMYAGPFYSSEKHPWPLNKSGNPAEPIIQIDLAKVTILKTGHGSFGDGLLQVFSTDWNADHTRVIPRADLSAPLMDVPKLIEVSYGPEDWCHGHGEVTHIYGFAGPYFSCCPLEFYLPENCSDPETIELAKLISEISGHNDSGFHLFGSFYPVQYRPGEEPPTFFALDCDYGYFWGDSGTAQVRFKRNTEAPSPLHDFDLMWSCY